MKKYFLNIISFFIIASPSSVFAEIDKIYHPYVEAHHSEIEYRSLYKNKGNKLNDGLQIHRFSFGHALTDRFQLEAYVIGENLPSDNFSIDEYELEGLYQLTEQGEFWADWGVLFEASRNTRLNSWETAVSLLWEKQWNDIITAINFTTEYEFGSGIKNEFETAFHSQIKYRLSRYFEPAFELYMDEETRGVGPVFLGEQKIGNNRLNWELGFIFGFNEKTADENFRFMLDYEF